jgi:hypothetical protein
LPCSSWPIKPCRTNLALGSGWPGTDVMILKIFSPKILAKKLAFFCSKLSYIMQKFNNYLHWFLRKAPIFFCRNCQKSHKIVIITSTPDWVNFGRLSDAGKVQGSMLWSFPIFGEKIGVFLNTNVMINFFQNLALFWVKNAVFFAEFFGENIFLIITSVPGNHFRVQRSSGKAKNRLQEPIPKPVHLQPQRWRCSKLECF